MIHGVFRKTKKKGLLVHFDDAMISQFQNEDDFIISLVFDNQKGHFDMYLHYWIKSVSILFPIHVYPLSMLASLLGRAVFFCHDATCTL